MLTAQVLTCLNRGFINPRELFPLGWLSFEDRAIIRTIRRQPGYHRAAKKYGITEYQLRPTAIGNIRLFAWTGESWMDASLADIWTL